jgi:hypothetical protein
MAPTVCSSIVNTNTLQIELKQNNNNNNLTQNGQNLIEKYDLKKRAIAQTNLTFSAFLVTKAPPIIIKISWQHFVGISV